MTVEQAIDKLQDQFNPSDHICMIIWEARDIQCPDSEKPRVLATMEDTHDANIGINWDVIEECIQLTRSLDR